MITSDTSLSNEVITASNGQYTYQIVMNGTYGEIIINRPGVYILTSSNIYSAFSNNNLSVTSYGQVIPINISIRHYIVNYQFKNNPWTTWDYNVVTGIQTYYSSSWNIDDYGIRQQHWAGGSSEKLGFSINTINGSLRPYSSVGFMFRSSRNSALALLGENMYTGTQFSQYWIDCPANTDVIYVYNGNLDVITTLTIYIHHNDYNQNGYANVGDTFHLKYVWVS